MHVPKPQIETMMPDRDLRLLDDELLVERSKSAPDEFRHIYDLYSGSIYRMCLRACGDPDLADDLTAAIFLKAFERLHQYRYRDGSTFRSWLFKLARNSVHDHWRKNSRISTWGEDEPVLIEDSPGPEEIALSRIELAEVRAILETLNDRHRSIVEYRLSGLNTREIADALGITISALKSAQTRAYANIRARLSTKGVKP